MKLREVTKSILNDSSSNFTYILASQINVNTEILKFPKIYKIFA